MKKIVKFVTAAAVLVPAFANAGAISADLKQTSQDAGKASTDMSASAEQSLNDLSVATINVSKNSANEVSKDLTSALKSSKDLAIKGWDISEKGATIVIASSKKDSQSAVDESEKIAHKVITASGRVIDASVDESKSAIKVSVKISEDAEGVSITILNDAKTAAIGSIRLSKEAASDILSVSHRIGDKLEDSAKYLMDKAGHLIRVSANETKEILGQASNEASEGIRLVVDKSGHILTVSADNSVMVVRGSGEAIKTFASATLTASKKMAGDTSEGMRASARGSMMILKASGKTIRLLSEDVEGLFYSEKE